MSTVLLEIDDDPVMELFKEPEKIPVSFKDDPVVLACAAYRMGTYTEFENIDPTAEDRVLGAAVRRHFMDKLVFQRLRGIRLSPFREKLGAFLVDNRPLYKDEIGMLYHLPYFYFEDLEVQSLVESVASVDSTREPTRRAENLKPYKKITLKRKGGAIQQYWWTDRSNRPYCLSLRDSGEHQHLYASIFDFGAITVEAHMYAKPFRGTDKYYYQLMGTKLLSTGQ